MLVGPARSTYALECHDLALNSFSLDVLIIFLHNLSSFTVLASGFPLFTL